MDCLDYLRSCSPASFDVVLADPPFGIGWESTHSAKPKRRGVLSNDARPFIWWLHDAYKVLTEPGALMCFCRWDCSETWRTAIELAGFKVRSQIVWDRGLHGMGDLRTTWAPRHDLLWYATKGRVELRGKRPASVIKVMRICNNFTHPTEKPVDLFRQLLAPITPPSGRVLDPFMGVGGCGVACQELGYGYTGIELDKGYYSIACERLGITNSA